MHGGGEAGAPASVITKLSKCGQFSPHFEGLRQPNALVFFLLSCRSLQMIPENVRKFHESASPQKGVAPPHTCVHFHLCFVPCFHHIPYPSTPHGDPPDSPSTTPRGVAAVGLLLGAGAPVDAKALGFGPTALIYAARRGHAAVARWAPGGRPTHNRRLPVMGHRAVRFGTAR